MEHERETTCCFTGHRPEKLPWGLDETDPRCQALKAAMADMLALFYADGFQHFICGMAAGTDLYFGEAVAALREEHPDVTLEAAIPFRGQERGWPETLRKRYFRLSVECDETTVLHSEYVPGCMMERNRYMVDRSSLLLAVYDGRRGGTYNTIRYAERRKCLAVVLPVDGLSPDPAPPNR